MSPSSPTPRPMTPLGVLQIVATWGFSLCLGVATSVVMLATLGLLSEVLTVRVLRLWGRTMLWMCRVDYEVEGAEHLAADTARVITFNHGSFLDSMLVTAVMPERSVAAIKREVLFYPMVGTTLYLMGFLLLDRRLTPRARRTMARAAARMRNERLNVFIAPEGSRATTPELLPFKKGAFHLVLETGAQLVPMLIDGAFELLPPHALVVRPGRVRIRFMPPRDTSRLSLETLGQEAESLRAYYAEELARFRAERGGREPA